MHKTTLREIAKFLTGLVAGDFLTGLWIFTSGRTPISIMGFQFSSNAVLIGMLIDVILFAFLFHYGWRNTDRKHGNGEVLFHRIAGTIFGIVAIVHLIRIIFGLQLNLFGWNPPYWINLVGVVVAGFLSYASFELVD